MRKTPNKRTNDVPVGGDRPQPQPFPPKHQTTKTRHALLLESRKARAHPLHSRLIILPLPSYHGRVFCLIIHIEEEGEESPARGVEGLTVHAAENLGRTPAQVGAASCLIETDTPQSRTK